MIYFLLTHTHISNKHWKHTLVLDCDRGRLKNQLSDGLSNSSAHGADKRSASAGAATPTTERAT